MSTTNRLFIPRPDLLLGDRYQLIECLGEGSYGWAWRAERIEDGTTIALKIPKAQASRRSDLEEGKWLIGRPAHPNVIQIFWMGRVPPQHEWFVIEMEYFPSVTLAQLLDQDDPAFSTSYDRLLEMYAQVLAGVRHLHGLNLCHGDIKPQNILVSERLLKLTDFGSSYLPDDLYAKTRENGGTVLYSAPEVVGTSLRGRGTEQHMAADIYSLGVLLYHLVTSRLPHETLSQVARHTPYPRPSEVNSTVSPLTEEFILRCLEPEPTDRWRSVAEMQQHFEQVRYAQLQYQPLRAIGRRVDVCSDWASRAVSLMSQGRYREAEQSSGQLFERSRDPHAFLCMVSAAFKDERYFDALAYIDTHPEMASPGSAVRRDLLLVSLKCYLATRQVTKAEQVVDQCISETGESPSLMLEKASILGLQAKYEESCAILMGLNKEFPQRPQVLKRLVLVYEQLRDMGKAAAFLKAYRRIACEDPWLQQKMAQFSDLGLV
ncbi:MAG: serine/threonine protein kinase [Acidobacteria bacterium]|nr:serine/threonine protein kinase [Acidobacteriota bacterium]